MAISSIFQILEKKKFYLPVLKFRYRNEDGGTADINDDVNEHTNY
jgi:hypothetical protein